MKPFNGRINSHRHRFKETDLFKRCRSSLLAIGIPMEEATIRRLAGVELFYLSILFSPFIPGQEIEQANNERWQTKQNKSTIVNVD